MAKEVDSSVGIEYCGDEDIYREVIEQFVAEAEDSIGVILDYKDAQDIQNYTIKVHALKSTARLVGAMELSEEAKYLEMRGKAEDIGEIMEKTDALIAHYRAVVDELKETYDMTESHPLGTIDRGYLNELITSIREACATFDFDQIDEAIKEMGQYDMPDGNNDGFAQLKKAAYAVDMDAIEAALKELE